MMTVWVLVFWINGSGMTGIGDFTAKRSCEKAGIELSHKAYGRSDYRCIQVERAVHDD